MVNEISINDLLKRQKYLSSKESYNEEDCHIDMDARCKNFRENYSFRGAMNLLRDYKHFGTIEEQVDGIFNVLEAVCVQDTNERNMQVAINYVTEAIIDRPRDAVGFKNVVKSRMYTMKQRLGGQDKSSPRVWILVKKSFEYPPYSFDESGDVYNYYIKPCLEDMETKLNNICYGDTIINNEKLLSKRFNISNVFKEAIENNCLDYALESMSRFVDTYDVPINNKVSIAIENSALTLANQNQRIDQQYLCESIVSDYLLMYSYFNEGGASASSGTESCQEVDDEGEVCGGDIDPTTHVCTKCHKKQRPLSVIRKEAKEKQKKKFESVKEAVLLGLNEAVLIDDSMKDSSRSILTTKSTMDVVSLNDSPFIDYQQIAEALEEKHGKKDFKEVKKEILASPDKSPSKIKKFITNLYADSKDNIVNDTANVSAFLIQVASFAAFGAIHPLLGLIAVGVNKCIQMKVNRKQARALFAKLNADVRKAKVKRKSTKDPKQKENLDAYIKKVEGEISKVESYMDTINTEEENDNLHSKEMEKDDKSGVDGLDDLKFESLTPMMTTQDNFNESYIEAMNDNLQFVIHRFDNIMKFNEAVAGYDEDDLLTLMEENYGDYGLANTIADLSIKNSDIVDRDRLKSTYRFCLKKLQNECSMFNDNTKIQRFITEAMEKVDNAPESELMPIHEMNVLSQLTMAKDQVSNTFKAGDAKQERMSKELDANVASMKKSIAASFARDGRDAVIKDSLVPSLSKCIKIGIVAAAAGIVVHPIASILTVVGYLAARHSMARKEAQQILDEIDIELVMCERQLKKADEKGNEKAFRSLMFIKKKLQRERDRLKYKVVMDWDQKLAKKHDYYKDADHTDVTADD